MLWKTYSAWLVFCSCILILTNGFASLTLIREYRFYVLDVLLTYGLLIFWGVLEAAVLALIMVWAELTLEKIFKRSLDLAFRVLLLGCFAATWLILALAVLRFLPV